MYETVIYRVTKNFDAFKHLAEKDAIVTFELISNHQ